MAAIVSIQVNVETSRNNGSCFIFLSGLHNFVLGVSMYRFSCLGFYVKISMLRVSLFSKVHIVTISKCGINVKYYSSLLNQKHVLEATQITYNSVDSLT